MKRIENNELKLNKLNSIISTLEKDISELESSIKDYKSLNKYYGSKAWFKDKDDFEKGKYSNIKAGVLSEDAVWNMDEDMKDLLKRMKSIIKKMTNK